MTQPEAMKTKTYNYGVETLNGYDAWALFEACAVGDLPKATALLAKDRRLVNAQFWYQFPIHMAVRAGREEIVELLLDQGADPGRSRFTYNSWDKCKRTVLPAAPATDRTRSDRPPVRLASRSRLRSRDQRTVGPSR